MRKKLLAATVAALAVAVTASAAFATHAWGNYHWARTSNPFTIKLGDNVTSTWDSYLNTASSQWSVSSVLDTTVVPGLAKGKCRPTAGRVEVCNGSYGNNGWLGLASIWASGDHITQGTVKLNDTYFSSASYNTIGWRSLVMCQEVGHTFGLTHQDEDFNNAPIVPHTCMDYFRPDANETVGPNQHDYDELGIIYAHLDSTTTIGSAVGNTPGNAPSFSQASRANGSVYVDHLPNGDSQTTFVFWTPNGD